MIAKTQTEVETLREAGRRQARLMREVLTLVRPDISSWDLEEKARAVTASLEAAPSFLNYKNKEDKKPYPTALCVSINNEIAHSPPRSDKMLKAGDVVSIDFGINYKGFYMDSAVTVGVSVVDAPAQNLLRGTREALDAGLAAARAGGYTGDIGAAVEAVAKKYKLGVVKDLRGHGVGGAVHELPNIPNYGRAGEGEELQEGLVIAMEPIFAEGSGALKDAGDGFTYVTADGSRAAHFEETILLTKDGVEVLTKVL